MPATVLHVPAVLMSGLGALTTRNELLSPVFLRQYCYLNPEDSSRTAMHHRQRPCKQGAPAQCKGFVGCMQGPAWRWRA